MGLVQLTSLGEHIIKNIMGNGIVNILQNNLLESNEYIIHSNLEMLTNIFSLEPNFQNDANNVIFKELYKEKLFK